MKATVVSDMHGQLDGLDVGDAELVKYGKSCEKHLADQQLVPLEMFVGGDCNWGGEGVWEVWHPNWDLDVQKETKNDMTTAT